MNNTDKGDNHISTSRDRPLLLTALSVFSLLFATYKLVSVFLIFLNKDTISKLDLTVSLYYPLISGLIWSAIGYSFGYSVFARKSWASITGMVLGFSYTGFYWFDRLWISGKEQPILFELILTLVFLSLLTTILNLNSTRVYFGKNGVKIP